MSMVLEFNHDVVAVCRVGDEGVGWVLRVQGESGGWIMRVEGPAAYSVYVYPKHEISTLTPAPNTKHQTHR